MIGEILDARVVISPLSGQRQMRFYIEVDNKKIWTPCALDHSHGIFLIGNICNISYVQRSEFIGKLIPMTVISFESRAFWTFDWIQMRKIAKDRKLSENTQETSNHN